MSAHSNWRQSKYSTTYDKFIVNTLKKGILEHLSERFEMKKKLRYRSDKLLTRFVGIMKASGKFLVSLRNFRKKKSFHRIQQLMNPILKSRKMK